MLRITVNHCKPREAVVLVAAPAPALVFFSGNFLCLLRHLVQLVILHASLYLFIFLILLFAKTGCFDFLRSNSYTVITPPHTHIFLKSLFYYTLFIYFECQAFQACGNQRTESVLPYHMDSWDCTQVVRHQPTNIILFQYCLNPPKFCHNILL